MFCAWTRKYRRGGPIVYSTTGEGENRLFRTGTSHVLHQTGVVIGTTTAQGYRRIVIEFFNEGVFRIDGLEGAVQLSDEPVGRITEKSGNYWIAFYRPLPTVIAMIVVTTFIANRQALCV
jgi:hypothetical protein